MTWIQRLFVCKSMIGYITKVKVLSKDKRGKNTESTQRNERYCFMLKEIDEKEYTFPNSDMSLILEDLLQKIVIELSNDKCPKK